MAPATPIKYCAPEWVQIVNSLPTGQSALISHGPADYNAGTITYPCAHTRVQGGNKRCASQTVLNLLDAQPWKLIRLGHMHGFTIYNDVVSGDWRWGIVRSEIRGRYMCMRQVNSILEIQSTPFTWHVYICISKCTLHDDRPTNQMFNQTCNPQFPRLG